MYYTIYLHSVRTAIGYPLGEALAQATEKPAYLRVLKYRSLRRVTHGHLKVTAGKTFQLSEVQQAHEYGRGHGRGRIVLLID